MSLCGYIRRAVQVLPTLPLKQVVSTAIRMWCYEKNPFRRG